VDSQELCRKLKRNLDLKQKEQARLDTMFRLEEWLWRAGVRRIAGVDEVGIGPMAGPVVAAAVVFPGRARIEGVDDSKRLAPRVRESLSARIRETASGVGIGVVEPEEVDRLNVYHAGLKAMRLAVEALPSPPQHVLVDGRTIPSLQVPQDNVKGGDRRCFAIACASIVAKVYRDRLMVEMDDQFPGYGFAAHKGYCTWAHQEAVRKLVACSIHRHSFNFIRELQGAYPPLFYELKHEIQSVTDALGLQDWEQRFQRVRASLSTGENRKLRLLARRQRHRLSHH
jgi:ribonuclease HII